MYQPRCSTRRSSSGNNFRQLTIPKTNSFRDTYFFRIVNLWNALPNEITTITSVSLFKSKLKSFYFQKLQYVFDQDDIRSYKIIVPSVVRQISPQVVIASDNLVWVGWVLNVLR